MRQGPLLVKIAYFEAQQTLESPKPSMSAAAIAELPGFVWQLDGVDDHLSVWNNPTALLSFVTMCHGAGASPTDTVAWWVPDRHRPTIAEAQARFDFVSTHGASPYAFSPLEPQQELLIERVWLDSADVQLLISQLNSDLSSRYPEPGVLVFSLDSADIVDGVGALLMASHDGWPVGCGAFRIVDDQPGCAEIKRMYVSLAGRGKKIGAAMLVELERMAYDLGVQRLILETGPRQPEALHRYGQAGYVICEPWGEFAGKELSICMEKVRRTG